MQPEHAHTAASEFLTGLVERVTFHNAETGYCVLRGKARGQRDLVTVVGHAAATNAGAFVQASGAWVSDRTHGLQFKAAFLKASPPTTKVVREIMLFRHAPRVGTSHAVRIDKTGTVRLTVPLCQRRTAAA